jgi:hypothetical protein
MNAAVKSLGPAIDVLTLSGCAKSADQISAAYISPGSIRKLFVPATRFCQRYAPAHEAGFGEAVLTPVRGTHRGRPYYLNCYATVWDGEDFPKLTVTERYGNSRISSAAHSTTLPPLRGSSRSAGWANTMRPAEAQHGSGLHPARVFIRSGLRLALVAKPDRLRLSFAQPRQQWPGTGENRS